MNNKKLIRLTESDLHRIVKESVKKILSEADPRSWAAVASRYNQTDPQKAAYARQRAAQQWNNQYSNGCDRMTDSFGDEYGILKNNWNGNTRTQNVYRPKNDVTDVSTTEFDKNYTNPNTKEMWRVNGYNGRNEKGANVARQMAQGNGVYDKNSGGWQ